MGSIKRSLIRATGLDTSWGRKRSAFARSLPDFIVIGAMKCGTTSLFNYLSQHPSVVRATKKEVHFFDNHFHRGLDWYRAHFPLRYSLRRKAAITGEGSPYYLFHPHAPARIHSAVPGAKLIVVLRDPVKRAFSHYMHEVSFGREVLSFEDAIDREQERLHGELDRMLQDDGYSSFNHQNFSYLSRGVYADQLEQWLQLFSRDQLLVLRAEDLFSNPSHTLGIATDFLGIAPLALAEYRQLNSKAGGARIKPETRERLYDYFDPHNRRLNRMLGRDFRWGAQ
jgi:hypothetical protein